MVVYVRLFLLYQCMVLLTATVTRKMHGSGPPGDQTNLILDEVFAESKLQCATLCAERNCSSILYVDIAFSSDDCFTSTLTTGYVGNKLTTATGRTCQRWDTQTPHAHSQVPTNLPEATLPEAENYCRNPDLEPGIWCYTTDPNKRWEFCDIWRCLPTGTNCRLFNKTGATSRDVQSKYMYYTMD